MLIINRDNCVCGHIAKYAVLGVSNNRNYNYYICQAAYNDQRIKRMAKPTHIRKKNGKKVYVERHEGNILVVRNLRGKVLGSYGPEDRSKFAKRYESLLAGKVQ